MLQRTPRREAKRRQMARWRQRNKRGVPYVGGDRPPALIDIPARDLQGDVFSVALDQKNVDAPTQREPW
jgi:hypothetical protein